jgi:hypothetical protein
MTIGSVQVPERIDYVGHGMIESASPTTSVGHVALHEGRHLSDFEARARREGRVVLAKDVDIHTELRHGVLVAVSGKATAILSRPLDDAQTQAADDQPQHVASDERANAKQPGGTEPGAARLEQLDRTSAHIDGELTQARRDIEQAERELHAEGKAASETASDRDHVAALKAREARLRAERSRLERARSEELARRAQRTATDLLDAASAATDVALGIALMRSGARRPRKQNGPADYDTDAGPLLLSRLV